MRNTNRMSILNTVDLDLDHTSFVSAVTLLVSEAKHIHRSKSQSFLLYSRTKRKYVNTFTEFRLLTFRSSSQNVSNSLVHVQGPLKSTSSRPPWCGTADLESWPLMKRPSWSENMRFGFDVQLSSCVPFKHSLLILSLSLSRTLRRSSHRTTRPYRTQVYRGRAQRGQRVWALKQNSKMPVCFFLITLWPELLFIMDTWGYPQFNLIIML